MVKCNNATAIVMKVFFALFVATAHDRYDLPSVTRWEDLADVGAAKELERKIFLGGRREENRHDIELDMLGVWRPTLQCLFYDIQKHPST
jgi:hypothetical protein